MPGSLAIFGLVFFWGGVLFFCGFWGGEMFWDVFVLGCFYLGTCVSCFSFSLEVVHGFHVSFSSVFLLRSLEGIFFSETPPFFWASFDSVDAENPAFSHPNFVQLSRRLRVHASIVFGSCISLSFT